MDEVKKYLEEKYGIYTNQSGSKIKINVLYLPDTQKVAKELEDKFNVITYTSIGSKRRHTYLYVVEYYA